MGIHVNLLHNTRDYKGFESVLKVLKIITVSVGCLCFVTLIGIFFFKGNAQKILSEETSQEKALVSAIQKDEDKEAQILLIQEKMKGINSIISETPDYPSQVETILAFMPQASASGTLQTLAIDANAAEVLVSFPNITALTTFLDTIDSPVFQKTFSDIELSSIAYTDPNKELRVQLNVGFGKKTH